MSSSIEEECGEQREWGVLRKLPVDLGIAQQDDPIQQPVGNVRLVCGSALSQLAQ